MFNEDEDWNDEQDVQGLSKGVQGNIQTTNSSTNVKSIKVVGRKSLLRTLQTLGSVPEWKSNDQKQDSDSEREADPSHSQRKRKKRKKRKPAEESEEQQKNGNISHTVKKDEPLPKKKKVNKPGKTKLKSTSAGETKDEEIIESPQVTINKLEGEKKMTRQQWKNKMRNKRKCKNKYRENKPEEDVNKAKTSDIQSKEIKINSLSSKKIAQPAVQKQKKEGETKLLKTKNKRQENVKKTKSNKTEKGASESSGDGSKQKAGELKVQITNDQQVPTKDPKHELTKEQILKRKKLWRILNTQETDQDEKPADQKDPAAAPEKKEEEVKQSPADSLRSRMEQRLESARFRYINEVLYTTTSGEARRMFQQDPQAFRIYHKGYTAQVQRWPANPVDVIISYIQKKPPSLVVADFGCGDCKIARSVKNKVHCFDLAATCELVTVCDMSRVPVRDHSVDIAVFCLSLMGTNLPDFIAEANRVLKTGGILKIAEVASRFDNVRNFMTGLASLGFKMMYKDTENTHFYSFEFTKTGNVPKNVKRVQLELKPCVYKKR
ncbi:ribosomal RNA-processing protein 8 [Cololabis saira]|uniref:ribosomal RNA-processing protein 8 n=1 Tax=Cololabis saira TaxID=129043 RepID=UPI002AD422AD|nr:ribosomal RNA-processing protein 8 [Cololabis saira]